MDCSPGEVPIYVSIEQHYCKLKKGTHTIQSFPAHDLPYCTPCPLHSTPHTWKLFCIGNMEVFFCWPNFSKTLFPILKSACLHWNVDEQLKPLALSSHGNVTHTSESHATMFYPLNHQATQGHDISLIIVITVIIIPRATIPLQYMSTAGPNED